MKQTYDIYRLAFEARDGDHRALALLVDTVRMRLFSGALSVSRNYSDAQDAVASTVVEICLHINDLREPAGIVTWMNRIVRREALRIRRATMPAPLSGDEPDTRQDVRRAILRIDVDDALHRLPLNQAIALRSFYFGSLSIEEIAAAMNTNGTAVSAGQVKTWLHRGRRQLAEHMKGYNEMKTKTSESKTARAALLCSDLPGDIVDAVKAAMRGGGFEPDVISGNDIPEMTSADSSELWTKDHVEQSRSLTHVLKQYDALVFDERIGRRTGLEFILFCKSSAETVRIPVTLLHSPPADAILIQACATVGIAHLVDKSDPVSLAAAFRQAEQSDLLSKFSDDARQVVYFGQEEARKLHDNYVSTEHLLLGLLRDSNCNGARILGTQCGTSIAAVRSELAKHLQHGPGHNEALGMQLTPRCKRVVDMSLEEATQAGKEVIGSEHLLLALIRENQGLAGKVLEDLGVSLGKARDAVSRLYTRFTPRP